MGAGGLPRTSSTVSSVSGNVDRNQLLRAGPSFDPNNDEYDPDRDETEGPLAKKKRLEMEAKAAAAARDNTAVARLKTQAQGKNVVKVTKKKGGWAGMFGLGAAAKKSTVAAAGQADAGDAVAKGADADSHGNFVLDYNDGHTKAVIRKVQIDRFLVPEDEKILKMLPTAGRAVGA